jgi:hypothetical protein
LHIWKCHNETLYFEQLIYANKNKVSKRRKKEQRTEKRNQDQKQQKGKAIFCVYTKNISYAGDQTQGLAHTRQVCTTDLFPQSPSPKFHDRSQHQL